MTGGSVNDDLGGRIGVTLRLITTGLIVGSVTGVLIGAYAAVKQYGVFDRLSTAVSFAVLAVPTVVLANILIIAAVRFNEAVGTQVFLVSGEATPGLQGGFLTPALDRLQHLILPTISLSLGLIAVYSRYQRNMMLDVLGADFIRTAMAKGLSRRAALTRHALRTALIPAVTYFAFTFGSLLVGTTFTEKIFGWHGMGEQLVNSISTNDVNTVAAISCFAAAGGAAGLAGLRRVPRRPRPAGSGWGERAMTIADEEFAEQQWPSAGSRRPRGCGWSRAASSARSRAGSGSRCWG